METQLGKIKNPIFGMGGYQDACIGFTCTLEGSGWGVGFSNVAWDTSIECTRQSRWTEEDRSKQYDDIVRYVSKLLGEAKVSSVDKLEGVPVEVTFEGTVLKSFRILTEVL